VVPLLVRLEGTGFTVARLCLQEQSYSTATKNDDVDSFAVFIRKRWTSEKEPIEF
jgi:hypothetical protein